MERLLRPGHRLRGGPPSLKSRLYLLIFLTLLPAFVLVIYSDLEERRLAVLEAHAENLKFARVVAEKEDSLVEMTHLLLVSLGQDIHDHLQEKSACDDWFKGFLRKYPRYANAGVVARDGRMLCSARHLALRTSVRKDSWFTSAIRTGKFSIGQYEFSGHVKSAALGFGLPIRNDLGRVSAVVFTMLDLGWLNRLVARFDLPAGSNVSIIDRTGVILAHDPDPEAWVGKSAKAMDLFRRVVLQGETRAIGLNDTPLIYAFTELPSARGSKPISVIVGIPEANVFAAATRTVWRNLLFLISALSVSLFVVWLGSERLLVRPLRLLGEAAARLASGDLSVRTHGPHETKEVHELASSFDAMTKSLERLEAERLRGEVALKEEAGIATALAGASKALISTLDTQVLLERLCESAAQVLGCPWSQSYLKPADASQFQPVASRGVPEDAWEQQRVLGVDPAAVSALEKSDILMLDAAGKSSPGFHRASAGSSAATMCMALRRGPELVGFQTAGFWSERNPPARAQMRIGEGLSQVASLALANASLLEEVEAASRVKTDFLATMSHELRTPCHIISGYLQLVIDGSLDPLTPKQSRALGKVQDNVRGLLELINTTLDLSRLESGRSSVSVEEFSLPDLLQEIELEAEPLLREKPAVEFVRRLESRVPTLLTDRGKLKVTLKNLVSNAIKFTDKGRIGIDVKARNGAVAIVVSDTGVGIAPEVIPVVFEMFRQGDSSVNRKYGGAGLGLHIVKRMVELLGGSVSVESQVGKGSTFTVRLPVDSRAAGVSRVA